MSILITHCFIQSASNSCPSLSFPNPRKHIPSKWKFQHATITQHLLKMQEGAIRTPYASLLFAMISNFSKITYHEQRSISCCCETQDVLKPNPYVLYSTFLENFNGRLKSTSMSIRPSVNSIVSIWPILLPIVFRFVFLHR